MNPTTIASELQATLNNLYDHLKATAHYKEFKKTPIIDLFLSFGYPHKRATVFHANKIDLEQAWKSILKQLQSFSIDNPSCIKLDIVTDRKPVDIIPFIELMTRTKKNYFRCGLSFDKYFKQAFLEQEINGNAMIQIDNKNRRGYLKEENIQSYIQQHRPGMKPIDFSKLSKVYIFTTKSYFYDGKNFYSLKNEPLDNGRRDIALTDDELTYLVQSGQNYLTGLSKENGKFIYGYFSCFDKEIDFYNMLRHSSTLYSMLEAYEFSPTEKAGDAIEKGLRYLIEEAIHVDMEEDYAFVVDGVPGDQEVKLGANAAAILAFTTYIEIFKDDRYLAISRQLANGMLRLQEENGSFNHVLHYPALTIKERFRIVYYDGEAAFAFMRLYKIDKNEKWIQAVEKAYEYFIEEEYWKNHDHWLSYCTNELTIYRPLEKYYKFGLDNTKNRLPFIYNRETTYPTFLELTLAAYKMVQRMKETGFEHLLKDFDENQLHATIHKRAEYQRNGFFYPELAMYFKNPQRIEGSFFIRHHSFRTRIDDIEHYLSGYIAYHNEFIGKTSGTASTFEIPEQ